MCRGKELAVLTAGCCWNERILAGARAKQTERLVPITSCEALFQGQELSNSTPEMTI